MNRIKRVFEKTALHVCLITVISCSNSEEIKPREPGTYSVFGFNDRIEISTDPKIDSIMNLVKPKVDSINDIVDQKVDSIMKSIKPHLDSVNKAYGIEETETYVYNFEIDYENKSIMFYENGLDESISIYKRIEPLNDARRFVIDENESYILYGKPDSIKHELGQKIKTLYK